MKKLFVCFVFSFSLTAFVFAQENEKTEGNEKLFELKKQDYAITIGWVNLLDSYLSPLHYKGGSLSFLKESYFLLRPEKGNISVYTRSQGTVMGASNPSGTALILYAGYNYAYGRHYHLNISPDFRLKVGGIADFDLAAKLQTANSNNPVSVDFSGSLNASVIGEYKLRLTNQTIDFRLSIETPLLGFMFVPEYGASYYEIFSLSNTKNCLHFSSFHNRIQTREHFQIGFETRFTYLNFGILHFYQNYQTNHLKFSKHQVLLTIGISRYMSVFKGKNNHPPSNFKSTDF